MAPRATNGGGLAGARSKSESGAITCYPSVAGANGWEGDGAGMAGGVVADSAQSTRPRGIGACGRAGDGVAAKSRGGIRRTGLANSRSPEVADMQCIALARRWGLKGGHVLKRGLLRRHEHLRSAAQQVVQRQLGHGSGSFGRTQPPLQAHRESHVLARMLPRTHCGTPPGAPCRTPQSWREVFASTRADWAPSSSRGGKPSS